MLFIKPVLNFMFMFFSSDLFSSVTAFRESASFMKRGDVKSFGMLFTDRWMVLSFSCALATCFSSSIIFAFTIISLLES